MTWLSGHQAIHLVGVGGAGMSGLAKLLAQSGHTVTGSDLKPGRALAALRGLGIECWTGHQPERAGEWDLVVASSAVPMERDLEVGAARAAGVEIWERPRLLAEMTAVTPGFGLAGTHGKTTSSAMTVAALRALGRDPSFMVGGQLVDLNTNAHLGERGLFVLEADEAFGTFVELSLSALMVTSVEADHLDHYGTLDTLEAAFAEVAARTSGPVVVCLDDHGAAALAPLASTTYGFNDASAWQVVDLRHQGGGVAFDLVHEGSRWPVRVPKPGAHIAQNAAGVLALVGSLGLDVGTAAEGLEAFAGVRRRFEVRARLAGLTVVDDYAHHPTEVRATLDAAREGSDGRIVAVFQPHRFSRTGELASEFGAALSGADVVVVTDVYAAGEAPIPGVTGRLVAEAIDGPEVAYVPRRLDVAHAVVDRAASGDLVLIMGAGDITLVPDELAAALAER